MKPALATVLKWPMPLRWLGLAVLLLAVVIGWCCVRFSRFWRAATPPGQIFIPILLVALFLALHGCAHVYDQRYSAKVLSQDDNSCAANPRALPGCVIGLALFVKFSFD